MKMRTLSVIVLVLALVLLAASLVSRGLLDSIRDPEVYDPRGGPLAVDGLSIGMTYDQVVRATGQRPKIVSTIFVDHVIPGFRLDPLVGFRKPEGGSLEDATVARVEGSVLTQDGRVLLDFHSVTRRNPPRADDVFNALGRPGSSDGSNRYYYLGTVDLIIVSADRNPVLAEGLKLISLWLSDRPAPHSAHPPQPDPEGSVKP